MSSVSTQLIIETIVKGAGAAKSQLDTLTGGIDKVSKESLKFAAGLAAVGTAVGALGLGALKAAAQYEQSQISFTTMLGSASAANDLLEKLADFSKRTPFELV